MQLCGEFANPFALNENPVDDFGQSENEEVIMDEEGIPTETTTQGGQEGHAAGMYSPF